MIHLSWETGVDSFYKYYIFVDIQFIKHRFHIQLLHDFYLVANVEIFKHWGKNFYYSYLKKWGFHIFKIIKKSILKNKKWRILTIKELSETVTWNYQKEIQKIGASVYPDRTNADPEKAEKFKEICNAYRKIISLDDDHTENDSADEDLFSLVSKRTLWKTEKKLGISSRIWTRRN